MSNPSTQAIRRYVMTASVAAITATGAWYGAGLKTRQEFKEEQKLRTQASPVVKIEQLELRRAKLLEQKMQLQRKIDGIGKEGGGGQSNHRLR